MKNVGMISMRVREYRKQAGMSQKDLALAAGLDQSALSRIERGQRDLSLRRLAEIARALGTTPAALLVEPAEAG